MKASKSLLLPIAFALTAGAAFAEGPLEGNEVFNFQSTLSRADVQAQVAPAYKADQIARGEANPAQAQATVVASQLSRAQVLVLNRLDVAALSALLDRAEALWMVAQEKLEAATS